MNDYENLAWIDIETTGLRPKKDAILEIGLVVTTKRLDVVSSKNWVIRPSTLVPVVQIDPYVFKMHNSSELWEQSINSELCLIRATDEATGFLQEYCALGSPACGSSVHFDRGFLKAQAPRLDQAFHYRNIDVSTIRNLMEIHKPEVFESRPKDENRHRAIPDLINSIDTLRHYLQAMDIRL